MTRRLKPSPANLCEIKLNENFEGYALQHRYDIKILPQMKYLAKNGKREEKRSTL